MKKLFLMSIIVSLSGLPSLGFAHGTDKPGPHGGMIQMPGPYHVEAVRKNQTTFHIFLLDMEFNNPTIKNSSVKARILAGKNLDLNCTEQKQGSFYICKSSRDVKPSETLVVESVREGAKGNQAEFQFKP